MPFLSQQRHMSEKSQMVEDISDEGDNDDSDRDDLDNESEPYLSADEPMFGPFAASPQEFENSKDIRSVPSFDSVGIPATFLGSWIRISLPIAGDLRIAGDLPDGDLIVLWLKEASVAVLGCRRERQHHSLEVGIIAVATGLLIVVEP